MDIRKENNSSELTVTVSGRIDTTTAPALEQEVMGSLEGITKLVLNFADVSYISSAGLRVLLSAQKTMNKQGTMEVHNCNEVLMEIFDVTGFADILTLV